MDLFHPLGPVIRRTPSRVPSIYLVPYCDMLYMYQGIYSLSVDVYFPMLRTMPKFFFPVCTFIFSSLDID